MGAGSVGQIDLDLGLNYGSFNNQLHGIAGNAQGMVGSSFGKLGGIIAAAFAIRGLVRFGSSCIELASNLAEVQNVVDVTFGAMSGQINEFASTALNKFGLSELSAKKFSSTMGAMLKSSGITGQALVDMSTGVTGLAGDMSSFYNISGDEAFNKIRAGLSGETEPLKQLGVNMSVANMEAYALSQGITKSYQSMGQAEQTLLRYNYLLSVTKDAQGDFQRTAGGWANQTRLLGEQFKILQGTLGQGFINMLTPVVKGLNILISKLQTAAQYFKAFTEMLFGNAGAADTSNKAVEAAADGIYQTSSNMGSGLDGVGKAAKKAGKDIKGSLSSFDQLNTLGKKASESLGDVPDVGGGATPDMGKAPEVKAPDTSGIKKALEPLKAVLDAIIKPLQKINFEPLVAAFGRLKTALEPIGAKLFEGLAWAYNNVLVPLATWTIENLLPAFLDVLSGALTVLNPLLDALKPLAEWLWNSFLLPMATFTGGVIINVLKDLSSALFEVGKWAADNQETVRTMAIIIAGFFAAWKVVEVLAFIQASGGVVAAIASITTALLGSTIAKIANKVELAAMTLGYARDFVVGIGKATAAMVVNAAETLYLKALYGVDMIKAIASHIVALAKQVVQWALNTAALIANKVATIASTVAQVALTVATGTWNVICAIATGVTTAFNVALAILTSPITLVILAIVALVAGIIALIKNWDKVKEVASRVWSGVVGVWKVASTWFGNNVVDPIANIFKGLWNGIIDGMNFVIRGLNKLKIPEMNIPGFGKVGGFGIDIPQIPALAHGGLVSAPTLAMVGDNRGASTDPEVVSPLSKLKGMIGDSGNNAEVVAVLRSILEAIRGQRGDVILKVGESEFGRIAIKAINSAQRKAGTTLLEI